MSEKPDYTNRLIGEKSPYLLQHARNPVNWFPWGNEAFQAAQEEQKPILLSIGYATCHWCHVMERETFSDPELAQQLNETFVCIKVDREELPAVDNLYMEFAQAMLSGAAGWPLNIILTPDLEPFFAATYLPPKRMSGMLGVPDMIERVRELWYGDQKEHVVDQAHKIVEAFAQAAQYQGNSLPEKGVLKDSILLVYKMADPLYGGMRGAPKFPVGYQARLLINHAIEHGDGRALYYVERMLESMRKGGIYDHLGGGFARYATDEAWQIPHFEKMLYDNALIAEAYLDHWQLTNDFNSRQVLVETLNYLWREMTGSEGGYYSAEDAESEGREGYFYTWTYQEIHKCLGPEQGRIFCDYFGVSIEGNFKGRNVLVIHHEIEELAAEYDLTFEELEQQISDNKKTLWQIRERRIKPFKDDKVLTSWSGLLIHTMVRAGRALDDARYLDSAKNAAQFIYENLWVESQLYRRWREGDYRFHAGLDEYAFLIRSLITLFEHDCGSHWLQWAINLTEQVELNFKVEDGAYYLTGIPDSSLLLRRCQFSDGAEPSGNAVHAENLLRLYSLTLNKGYLDRALDVFMATKKFLETYPLGYCYHLMVLQRYFTESEVEIVISFNKDEEHKEVLRRLIFHRYFSHSTVIWNRVTDKTLHQAIPFLEQMKPIDGKTTLYVCKKGSCEKPINEFSEIVAHIESL